MILVTGGGGRIGRHLVSVLAKREKVRILLKRGERFKTPLETVEGDLLDKESLRKALGGCNVVYHLAAVVDYLAPKKLMWDVNVEGTRNILEAAKEFGIKKLVYLSSTAVYGKNHPNPADENTPCKPTNYYGTTKLEAERIVLKHNGIVLRSTDVYGPGFEEGYYTVFSLLEKGKLPIIGSGKNRIQYIHINDLVTALILAMDANPGVYLVAGKEIKTQEELIEICCKYLGCEKPKRHIPVWIAKLLCRKKLISEYIDKLSADRTFNINKTERELGFVPKVTYEEGIAQMVKDYKR